MAEFGDGTSCSSTAKTDNEDTRRLMASMQEMMGTLVQKVTEMEKKYDEHSKAKDSSDSVYENAEKEMYTVPRRGEEDNLSSISAESQREERVSTESKKKGCAAGGSKEEDSASESDFCVTFQGPEEDVFALLEADLEKEEQAGKPVAEKLANITKNRFSVKLSEKKLKEKMDSHQIPENCLEIKAALLNEEIVERGNLRRVAYPCLKARKARWLRNTEIRAMQRKQGWKLGGSGFRKKIINSSDNYLCVIITLSPKQEK